MLPYLAIPVGLFLVKQFIDQIPNELIDAARVDGANDWQIYRRIVMPLIKPAVATIMILSFQSVWNSADTSTTYINDDVLKTFAFYMGSSPAHQRRRRQGHGAAASPSFRSHFIIFSSCKASSGHAGSFGIK